MSFDWYSINIKQAITTVSGNTIITLCNEGSAFWCGRELYDGASYPGALGHIEGFPINSASQTTSGLDFQADYAMPMPLVPGDLHGHLVGNYTDENTSTVAVPGVATTDKRPRPARKTALASNGAGLPKFKATLSATYTEGPWSATVQGRMIGAAVQASNFTSLNVANNNIPFIAYMDLRGSYNWTDNIQLYGAIDNFFLTRRHLWFLRTAAASSVSGRPPANTTISDVSSVSASGSITKGRVSRDLFESTTAVRANPWRRFFADHPGIKGRAHCTMKATCLRSHMQQHD